MARAEPRTDDAAMRARRRCWWLPALAMALAPVVARADEPHYQTTVSADAERDAPDERATSTVERAEMQRRIPRSAPDALRYEPGVFVQQTAHSQGSAFIRGLTGQQTLILFDGIRVNNSTYRQGPNQYFFTLDAATIRRLEVLRGGGSTGFGSDALGGVIIAHPVEAPQPAVGFYGTPRLFARGSTADLEKGARLQIEGAWAGPYGIGVGFVGGVGARDLGLLQSSGPVIAPATGRPTSEMEGKNVPRFAPDGRTQLGTGFKEVTGDARLVVQLGARHTITAAAYLYNQYDAPRTDQCPPPYAPYNECLLYEEQFRRLAYLAWDARLGPLADRARVTLSWQQQHEKRRLDRPLSFYVNRGIDDVDTLGITARAETAAWRPRTDLAAKLEYGAESYLDLLRSRAEQEFTDVRYVGPLSRGQYLDGSRYLYGGAFIDATVGWRRLTARAGARGSWIAARAPGDAESGTRAVNRAWYPLVGHVGVEYRALSVLHLLVNVDHSFRAPNLDDLTSRQQTGPGFQFENASLNPERATTFEAGVRLRHPRIVADLWAFETLLQGAVIKQPKAITECPQNTPQCGSSWSRFQLVNAPALSEVRGVEASAKVYGPAGLVARATVAYTWGEGPNPGSRPSDPSIPFAERVPLSRIPPLNGTVELYWTHRTGFGAGAALRWATLQDRLALADVEDRRIPTGGTPGFAVVDLRASYRVGDRLALAAVFENLFDTPYRYHGSSVNGPARGFLLSAEVAPF